MVTLFSAGNTNYTRNGDITLLPYSAEIHVILNSTWELTIKHPIDTEGRWAYIVPDSVVRVPTFLTDTSVGVLNGLSLWRIVEVEKTDDEITATAQPIFFDAASCLFYTDTRPTDKTGQEALDYLLTNYDGYSAGKYSFTAESDIETTATAYYQYVNFLEAVNGDIDQSFVNRWGGEITYDNFTIRINENAGNDNGVEIRYGKNIPENGFNITEDYSGIYTRIYPKGYNGITPTELYVDSENIANYETIRAVTITYDNIRSVDDCTPEYDDDGNITGYAEEDDDDIIICETQDEIDAALTAAAEAEFDNGLDEPSTTIECDLVLLGDTEQYADFKGLESVTLGDTVTINNAHLGYTTSAEVVELTFDALNKRVTAVTLGNYATTYFNTIAGAVASLTDTVTTLGDNYVSTAYLTANYATINYLESYAISTASLTADIAVINQVFSGVTISDVVEADYKVITQEIEAGSAWIGVLETAYTKTETLEATLADIDTLLADYAEIDTLQSLYASITTLDAYTATIEYLFADVTISETLLTYYALIDEAEIGSAWVGTLTSSNITTSEIISTVGYINTLTTGKITADTLIAAVADINTLTADAITVSDFSAATAQIEELEVDAAKITSADIDDLYATDFYSSNATVLNLAVVSEVVLSMVAYDITVKTLSATTAYISALTAGEITASSISSAVATVGELDATYANISFSNVDLESVNSMFVEDFLIAGNIITKTATIDEASVMYLTGVYISGDVIQAGTISCDRLLITGADSIVYEINATSEGLTSAELTEEQYQNYIDGSVLVAKSITADEIAAGTITADEIAAGTITAAKIAAGTITATEIAAGAITASKIDVSDLSAIGATIGGFEITTLALYSGYTNSGDNNIYTGLYCPLSVSENTVAIFAGAENYTGTNAAFSVTYGGLITSAGETVSTCIDSGILYFEYDGEKVAEINSYMATDNITGLSIETTTTGETGSYITMTAGVIVLGDEEKTMAASLVGYYAGVYGTERTTVGSSNTPTYINGLTYFDSYIYINNEEKICLYGNDGNAVVGQIYVTSGNGYNVASTNSPIYVYGTITYLGANNYGPTYIRGEGVYVGTSSYDTTLCGSSIIFDANVSSNINFDAGCGLSFYDSEGEVYGGLCMASSGGGGLALLDWSGDGLLLFSAGGLKLYGGDITLDEDTYFSESIYLNNSNYIYWYGSDETAVQMFYFGTSDTLYVGAANYDTTLQGSTLTIGTSSDIVFSGEISSHLYMLNSKAVYGYYSGTYYAMLVMGASGRVYLGDSTSTLPTYIRGKSIYMNGSAYSSDIRYKNSVAEIHDGYIELIDKLMPRRFKYNWDDENYYNGFVAQEVITALNECGIDDDALIRYDNESDRYAIDYNGILTALVAAYQKLNKRVKALEED